MMIVHQWYAVSRRVGIPDGTIIENVEAGFVEDDENFMPEIGFEKYPEATHFRKSK